MAIGQGDDVSVEFVGRLEDGTVFDTTREEIAQEHGLAEGPPEREYGTVTVEIGAGEIIEGIENALIGGEEGDEATFTVPPEKGYGEPDDDHVEEYDATEFAEMLEGQQPTVGMHIRTEEGATGHIVAVTEQVVRVDYNHELAGKTLEFDIEIVDVNG